MKLIIRTTILIEGYFTKFFPVSNAISIVSKEPGDGKIVKKGDRITLSCKTNRKWFFCLWKGPTGSTQVIYDTKTAINMLNI